MVDGLPHTLRWTETLVQHPHLDWHRFFFSFFLWGYIYEHSWKTLEREMIPQEI